MKGKKIKEELISKSSWIKGGEDGIFIRRSYIVVTEEKEKPRKNSWDWKV